MDGDHRSFCWAAEKGDLEAVEKYLKTYPARIDFVTEGGWTVFHYVARGGQTEIMQLLLRLGGRGIEFAAESGITPIDLAVHFGRVKIVRLMIRYWGSTILQRFLLEIAITSMVNSKTKLAIVQMLKVVGVSLNSNLQFESERQMAQEPLSDQDILRIRGEIYFDLSLVDRLIFFL